MGFSRREREILRRPFQKKTQIEFVTNISTGAQEVTWIYAKWTPIQYVEIIGLTDKGGKMGTALTVRVKNGWLVATESPDPDYPGIDVEYIADNDRLKAKDVLSRPRVLIEYPTNGSDSLRALIWNNSHNEDYEESVALL